MARLAYFTPNWLILLATGVKIFGTGLWLKTWLFLFRTGLFLGVIYFFGKNLYFLAIHPIFERTNERMLTKGQNHVLTLWSKCESNRGTAVKFSNPKRHVAS